MSWMSRVRASGLAGWGWMALAAAAGVVGCSASRSSCDFGQNGCAPAGAVLAAPCSGCGEATCGGGCGHAGWKQKLRDYDWEQVRPDHCWPTQYTHESVRRVNDPMAQQMANGLIVETTIYDHHFETGDARSQLSEPGKIRLQYLARRRPYQVRSLTLQASYDPALDQARANEVQAYLQKVSFEPGAWTVAVAPVVPTGLTGPEVAGVMANATGVQGIAQPLARKYETILRNTFFQGTGAGGTPGSSGS